MDELDILKKDWQKKGEELPKLSYNDIYKMIWKKSSSIVKWIFIISVLEFVLPHLLLLIPGIKDNVDAYDKIGLSNILLIVSIFQYIVVFYFIYQFYKRYKEISVLDDSKTLMRNIFKTRRTVKHYIIFSLSYFMLLMISYALFIYFNPDSLLLLYDQELPNGVTLSQVKIGFAIGIFVAGVLMVGFIGLVYFLLYGLLLRKLNKNYTELKRLEV